MVLALVAGNCFASLGPAGARRQILLDGEWQVGQGGLKKGPSKYDHTVPVPGLVDMAKPAFKDVGLESDEREAFWYRTTFRLESGDVPRVAILKLHKAKYGTQVFLNGVPLGQQPHCFTPGYFDLNVRNILKAGGKENQLTVRVGALPDVLPKDAHAGMDWDKQRYIPGIYDSVELILANAPYIESLQVAPDVENSIARIHAKILNLDKVPEVELSYKIREKDSGKIVAEGDLTKSARGYDRGRKGMEKAIYDVLFFDLRVPIKDCRLWSPEDPFLYEVELTTSGDGIRDTFGMRSFRFDPATGRAILNGRPYYLRGSNIGVPRFLEDEARGNLPWDREWVRGLYRKMKSVNWNSFRFHVGFPPDFWYDVADEEGLLIQDEYPIWAGSGGKRWPSDCTSEDLAGEYEEWMQERWNHPSVVIWDAQNESSTHLTAPALNLVRGLDLSERPWDNGYGAPQRLDDCQECHPYMYIKYRRPGTKPPPEGFLSDIMTDELLRFPVGGPRDMSPEARKNQLLMYDNPTIVNEYTPFYLQRDGSLSGQAENIIGNAYGTDLTREEKACRCIYLQAALTEYWRCHRQCAGVHFFAALSTAGDGAMTGDAFSDPAKLKMHEGMEEMLKGAFNPNGLMIDFWQDNLIGPSPEDFSVYVINDLYEDWKGSVSFRIERDGKVLKELTQDCEVDALGREILNFKMSIPSEKGNYKLVSELRAADGTVVQSVRAVRVCGVNLE